MLLSCHYWSLILADLRSVCFRLRQSIKPIRVWALTSRKEGKYCHPHKFTLSVVFALYVFFIIYVLLLTDLFLLSNSLASILFSQNIQLSTHTNNERVTTTLVSVCYCNLINSATSVSRLRGSFRCVTKLRTEENKTLILVENNKKRWYRHTANTWKPESILEMREQRWRWIIFCSSFLLPDWSWGDTTAWSGSEHIIKAARHPWGYTGTSQSVFQVLVCV